MPGHRPVPRGDEQMPAPSIAMRRAAAIAEHNPGKLYKRNRSLLGMTHKQMHDYASTPEEGLPKKSPKNALMAAMMGKNKAVDRVAKAKMKGIKK